MAERSITYATIATQQLEDALHLYLERSSYISAITLAGAAEEILGKMVKHVGKHTSLKKHVDGVMGFHEIFQLIDLDEKKVIDQCNKARNRAKHLDDAKIAGVIMDDKEEAKDLLNRAIDNYLVIFQKLSPGMKRFKDTVRSEV